MFYYNNIKETKIFGRTEYIFLFISGVLYPKSILFLTIESIPKKYYN